MAPGPRPAAPPGFLGMGVFLGFAAAIAGLAALTLITPGTLLDRAWRLNPTAFQQLAPLGRMVGIPFLLLGTALGFAAVGWFKRRLWGWILAVIVIAIQVSGDLVNAFMGHWLRGGIGVVIAGSLLWYLLLPRVRASFG